MLCSDETIKVQQAPVCSSALNLGTISNLSASLQVEFLNNSTGRLTIASGVSSSTGVAVVSLSEKFPVNNSISVFVYLTSDTSRTTPLNITIEGTTGNQILMSFRECYEFQDVNNSISEFQLSL